MQKGILKNIYRQSLKKIGDKKIFSLVGSLLHNSDQSIESYILYLVKTKRIDPNWLINLSYKASGIGDYGNEEHTGELNFLKNILPDLINKSKQVFFDVGANIGNYTVLLKNLFPDASIYSFEPNPEVFKVLCQKQLENVKVYNSALGREVSKNKIYTYAHSLEGSEHGSILKEVFTDLYKRSESVSYDIEINTIDKFCFDNGLQKIDFLKIDTEGYEFEVLNGAKQILRTGKIDVIQFEINSMNIISRVFLKDFYDLLGDNYEFYRLKKEELVKLGSYNTMNEIFSYQNIVIIRKDIVKLSDKVAYEK